MLKSGTVLGKSGALEKQTRGLQSGTVLGLASEEIRRAKAAEVQKTREYAEKVKKIQAGNNDIIANITADLQSGINSVGTRKMSAGLDYYVNGNPIPSKNPTPGIAGYKAESDKYARSATAGDGFENYSLEELKKLVDEREKQYKDMTVNGVQRVINRAIGIGNSGEKEYKDAKAAYENRLLLESAYLYPHKADFNSKSAYDNSINDLTYLQINNLDKFKEDVTLDKYRDISENEIKVYNYIYKTEGEKRANRYLSALENTLKNRAIERENTEAAEFADKHPIVASAKSIGTNVAGALEQGGNMVKYLATGDMDVNRNSMLTSTTRGKVMEKVNWEIGNWDAFDFIYGTAMSAADSMLAAPAGTAGAVMLGLSAAGQASNDILERGGTNEQAFWTGLAAGLFEGLFEKISIGNFNALKETAPDTVKTLIKNIAKSMLVNASEESATEIANITYDSLANADISQYQQLVSSYLQEGYSKSEAEKKAVLSLAGQVVEAGAGGALMGLGMGGAGSLTGYLTNRKANNNTTADTQTDTVNSVNETSDLQSTEKKSIFNETPADKTNVVEIGKALGWTVNFDDVYVKDENGNIVQSESGVPQRANGKVNIKNKQITIDNENERPTQFVMIHELADYLTVNKSTYFDFANPVMDSDLFKNWVKQKGYNSVADYNSYIVSERLRQGDPNFTADGADVEYEANIEMLSDFCGENLFSGEDGLNRVLKTLKPQERKGFIQKILDFFRSLKDKISGKNKSFEDEITAIEKKFAEAYRAADEKNTADEGGVRYSINSVDFEKSDFENNIKLISQMESVADLSGNEFAKGEKDLVTQVEEYFANFGYSVKNDVLGDVDITARGAKDSIAHGLGRNKAIAFAAVPNVIQYGKIIDYQKNWKGRGYDTVVLAAPISISGKPYFEGVIVTRDKNTQRFYVHEVITEERTDMPFKTGNANLSAKPGGTSSPSVISLLDKIRKVKEVSENDAENNERYSLPTKNVEDLVSKFEKGEIGRQELIDSLSGKKSESLSDIANLTEQDASTTPPLSKKKGNAQGDSESKTYESLQKSKIFDDKFKQEVKDDDFIKKYQSVTNKETLEQAAKELDEGGEAYVSKWWATDPKHSSLIDTAVGFILMDRYQRVGDYESSIAVAEKIREIGTSSGQQVQIFSILGRLNPDTMAVYAQKELSKAFDEMVKGKTQRWIDKNSERFNLTDEDIEFIRRRTLQAAKLPEGRDKTIRLAEIATLIQDKLPPQKGQALKALQRISMLLNPKTNIRNILGNTTMTPVFIISDFFGSGIDKIVSKKTGVRTTGNFKFGSVKEMKRGFFESYDDFKRHINTRNVELNRFEIGNGKSFNENHSGKLAQQLNDCAKVLNALDRFTSFCLEAGDRPFYEMWFTNSLNNQIKLNKATEATPKMIEIATLEALQRTWQDSNQVVKVVAGAKDSLNKINIGGFGLGDVMIKFTKTPANLTKAIFDFSPAGVIKSIAADGRNLKNAVETGQYDPMLQKKFVDSLSKGIAGTLAYIAIFALAQSGNLTGAPDDDKDVKNFERYIEGIPPYSVRIFGKWITYDWAQPLGSVAATVADYMQSKKDNPDNEWYNDVISAIKVGGQSIFDQSFMKSIQNLFTADNIVDGFIDSLLDEPSVYVPQVISQTANLTDKYRRITDEYDKPFKTALNKVKVKIPGLRPTLDKQVDVLGRDTPNSQHDVFNAFINPGNTYSNTSNSVSKELYSLYKQTGEATVIPRTAPYYITVKKKRATYTAKETAEYQKIMGETVSKILDEAFDEKEYENLSDAKKIKFVTSVYDYAAAKAKSSFVYSYEVLNSMHEGVITKEQYERFDDKAKKYLAEQYFMDDYQFKNGTSKIKGSEADYFLKKVAD